MPRYASASSTINRSQDSNTTQFKKNLSAADITTLKTDTDANFPGVSFLFSGGEFNYDVVLQGPREKFVRAMSILFPKGRGDITITPFQTLP